MRFLSEIPYPAGSKERKKALGRRQYQKNKEKLQEYGRIYRANNPEMISKKSRMYHNSIRGRARSLFSSARNRASTKNYEIDIDVKWIEERLNKGVCEMTGLTFVFVTDGKNYRNPYAPSLDRKDNLKGYTKDNCRVILWALNMGFANWGEYTYMQIAKHLVMEYDL